MIHQRGFMSHFVFRRLPDVTASEGFRSLSLPHNDGAVLR
jgi:hypothetical protein